LSISLKSEDGDVRVNDIIADPNDIFENSPAACPITAQDAFQETFKETFKDPKQAQSAWIKAMVARLSEHKRYPGNRQAPSGEIRIEFSIDRDGHLVSTAVKQSSGDPAFDTAAQCMVERSNPLPPPPPSMDPGAKVVRLTLPVNFRDHRNMIPSR